MKNLIIITGPSAVGKTTIAKMLFEKIPELKSAVTYTTRPKRDWSQEDKIIHHVSKNEFEQLINEQKLIEWAEVYGEFYGTAKKELLELLEHSPVLLNIDVQGAKNIQKQFPDSLSFFIQPDNLADLEKRINSRPIDKEIKNKRIAAAKLEMQEADQFTHQIINTENELSKTVAKIAKIIALDLQNG